MNINRNNYEQYFLDYLDGTLDTEQVKELQLFLEENPDLMNELQKIDEMVLEPKETVFGAKEELKKPQYVMNLWPEDRFENACIAYFEGDLSTTEKDELFAVIKQKPEWSNEFKLFANTYLKPEPAITYHNKQELRGIPVRQIRRRIFYYSVSVAAAVVFALLLLINPEKTPDSGRYTEMNKNTEAGNDNEISQQRETIAMEESTVTDAKKIEIDEEVTTAVLSPFQENDKQIYTEITDKQVEEMVIIYPEWTEPLEKLKRRPGILVTFPDVEESIMAFYTLPLKSLSKDYLGLEEYALSQIKSRLFVKKEDEPITFWDLANAGINGLDKISEAEYGFDRKYNEEGDMVRLAFETPIFGISTPVKLHRNLE